MNGLINAMRKLQRIKKRGNLYSAKSMVQILYMFTVAWEKTDTTRKKRAVELYWLKHNDSCTVLCVYVDICQEHDRN